MQKGRQILLLNRACRPQNVVAAVGACAGSELHGERAMTPAQLPEKPGGNGAKRMATSCAAYSLTQHG